MVAAADADGDAAASCPFHVLSVSYLAVPLLQIFSGTPPPFGCRSSQIPYSGRPTGRFGALLFLRGRGWWGGGRRWAGRGGLRIWSLPADKALKSVMPR